MLQSQNSVLFPKHTHPRVSSHTLSSPPRTSSPDAHFDTRDPLDHDRFPRCNLLDPSDIFPIEVRIDIGKLRSAGGSSRRFSFRIPRRWIPCDLFLHVAFTFASLRTASNCEQLSTLSFGGVDCCTLLTTGASTVTQIDCMPKSKAFLNDFSALTRSAAT